MALPPGKVLAKVKSEGRPGVIVEAPDGSIGGWVIRSPGAGWTPLSPIELLNDPVASEETFADLLRSFGDA